METPLIKNSRKPSAPIKWMFIALAGVFVILATLRLILPGLPTVPFLILAAWAASLGSTKMHNWIINHKHFGKRLADWEKGQVARSSKVMAGLAMSLSATILIWARGLDVFTLLALATMITVLTWLSLKPEPSKSQQKETK